MCIGGGQSHIFIDWYLPLSKVESVLEMTLPPLHGEDKEVVKYALNGTPYELHMIDNSALLRIYPEDKDSAWLDIVTSKVLRHKGVLYANKLILDKADPNLVSRIIGHESEQIQKEIKRIFDDKDLLERNGLFDVSLPSLVQRIKNKHPVLNYLLQHL